MEKTKVSREELCQNGRDARAELDKARWLIGDMALQAEALGFTRADFAKEIGLGKRAVQQYAEMCEFYSAHARALLFDTFESDLITYTHYRESMRMGTYGLAFVILEKAAFNAWTTDELAYHVGIELGSTSHERVYLAKEVPGMIHQSAGGVVTLRVVMSGAFILGDTVKVSVWREK